MQLIGLNSRNLLAVVLQTSGPFHSQKFHAITVSAMELCVL